MIYTVDVVNVITGDPSCVQVVADDVYSAFDVCRNNGLEPVTIPQLASECDEKQEVNSAIGAV